MEEEPPTRTDPLPATSPQTVPDAVEEQQQSIPQCEDVEHRQPIHSADESTTKELDRLEVESPIPIAQCPQSDDGGEWRSASADPEQAEKPQRDEEKVSTLQEEEAEGRDNKVPVFEPVGDEVMREDAEVELFDVDRGRQNEGTPQLDESVSSLKEEEEEKVPISEAPVSIAVFDDEKGTTEKTLEVDGSHSSEASNRGMPQLLAHSLKEHEEEGKAPIFEHPVVDEVMRENVDGKLLDVDGSQPTEELNGERPHVAEEDEKVYSMEEALMERDEKFSTSERASDGNNGDNEVLIFDEIMQENTEGKPYDIDGTEPAEQLDKETLHEKTSSSQEEFVGEEEKLPMSKRSGSITEEENDGQKLSEEKFNEGKPQPVRKRKKVSTPWLGLVEEEEENASSLQEEPAHGVQEELAEKDKEEYDEKEDADEMDMDEGGPATAAGKRMGSKRKRGRPPVAQGRRTRALPMPKEDEELCFICFDGGDLVVCDHRGCPKVYHPSCVNRDEAYFKAKGQWSCGWHICSNCQKSARYMCYTCTYSLCRRCIKEADFVCVRENKGFCETCMKIVMLIEMNKHADETTDVIDFDDKASWMYLFKDYWVDLKAKLSLTIEELTGARNPFKETNATSCNEVLLDEKGTAHWNNEHSENPGNASDDQGGSSSSSSRCRHKESTSSTKKVKKQPRNMSNKERSGKVGFKRTLVSVDIEWASKELLEFVAHMKDGDRSVISHFDVQALLLEYIKQNNLRDPRRKSQVVCDSRLRVLFGKSCVGHLEMLKLLEPHFLIKEASPLATDDNQGGVVDPDHSQTDAEGNRDASTKLSLDTRRKSRRRVEEMGPTDDYAAIDVHNVSLMYLRRNMMECFLDDIDMFNENVVGSFVRIRISGSTANKDMYRLVKVIGTGKAAGKYKTGKKMTDITLEILNLNKREFITIDLISNQEFTEDECKRLRQSVKCGFIDRPTVVEVQVKARALHAVKFNDWLESEKLRLGHLRDRASEKGRKKEHRECVEKLQLLSKPEERIRRLNEVTRIHIDPTMDPDYDSTEDEDDLNAKGQDNNRMRNSSFKDRDKFPARRGCSAPLKDSRALDLNKTKLKPGVQDVVSPIVPADRTDEFARNQENNSHQASGPETPKPETNATGMITNVLRNAPPVIDPGQLSGVRPATAPQPLLANVVSSNTSEAEKMWHYQDPAGKVQGPFSMTQLRKWNRSGFFPTNLSIWRTSEKQENSILLTDALNGMFHKDLHQQVHQHCNTAQPTNVAVIADTRVNNLGGGLRENNAHQNTASFPATGGCSSAQPVGWTAQPSPLSPTDTERIGHMDRRPATSSTGWVSSKNSNACSGQSQVYNRPGPVSPYSRNSSQQSSFQGRDGRGENNGSWNGAQGRQNNWNSNNHMRFQTNGRGYERQHSYQSSSSQRFPGEQWKAHSVSDSSNQLGSSSNFAACAAPQPSSIDWASLQGAINRILPSASPAQPMSSGPATVPRGREVQQSQANLTSPTMNKVRGWAANSVPNVNPAMAQETVGGLSNIQPQNRPSETAALITSGNHTVYSGSSTTEFVDRSDMKPRVEDDTSNATPNSGQACSDVPNSGCIQPDNSRLNERGDRTVSLNELDTGKKCPEARDTSASEDQKVDGTGLGLHCASVAPDALGSSDLPQASVSVKRSVASSSKAQSGSLCWAPASAQQQGPNNLSANPAQPLNMGWVTAPQNPNSGTGTVQQIGNMVSPAVPGAANTGWGMMPNGLMNMTWGTPANVNMGWVPPAQPPMSANLGWAIPALGNANANMACVAQAHANSEPSSGMPVQIRSAENPERVAPNTGSANPNPCRVAPTEGNANQNTALGAPMHGSGQGSMNSNANQSGGGGKTLQSR